MPWVEAPMDGKVAIAFIGVRLTIAVASNVGNISFRASSLVLCETAFSLLESFTTKISKTAPAALPNQTSLQSDP
jgi:hypothetical protein